jgi:formylglycine-generating enzyme required for sulfatase activity
MKNSDLSKLKNFNLFILILVVLKGSPSLAGNIEIPTVLVRDTGNPADTTGYGAVDYEYYIGKYEVTNAEYTVFLNAVAATDPHELYKFGMSGEKGGILRSGSSGSYTYTTISGRAKNPVNYVSFWDAARFTNWLTTGDTETGVYNLGGVSFPENESITRDATTWANGGVAIASQNEWYKAAFYSGSPTGADGDGYWLYPTASNTIKTEDANYGGTLQSGNLTAIGTFAGDPSFYGTYDQGGNVWEYTDDLISQDFRGFWGGAFWNSSVQLQSSGSILVNPGGRGIGTGFRVSSLSAIEMDPLPGPDVTVSLEMSTSGHAWVPIEPGQQSTTEPVAKFRAILSMIESTDTTAVSPATVILSNGGGMVNVRLTSSSDLTEWMPVSSGEHVIGKPKFFRVETDDVLVHIEGGTLHTSNQFDESVVNTFYIGKYEVTWGLWVTVRTWADANGYNDIDIRGTGCADDHPVHNVNWFDVVKWCNAKSEMEGLTPVYTVGGSTYRMGEPDYSAVEQNLSASGYRLPSAAEWEFAARGGNQTNGYTFAGSNDLNAVGWYQENSTGAVCDHWQTSGTWPVGQKLANEFVLHDISGNVKEWCNDGPHSPWVRGGSHLSNEHTCEVATLVSQPATDRVNGVIGFRLARSSNVRLQGGQSLDGFR